LRAGDRRRIGHHLRCQFDEVAAERRHIAHAEPRDVRSIEQEVLD
jgi:hypothetical protein